MVRDRWLADVAGGGEIARTCLAALGEFTDDGEPSTMFWSTAESPEFRDVGGEPSGGTMTATVMHFSAGFVGRKL